MQCICIVCRDRQRGGKWVLLFPFREEKTSAQELSLPVEALGARRKHMGCRTGRVFCWFSLAWHPGRSCVKRQMATRS